MIHLALPARAETGGELAPGFGERGVILLAPPLGVPPLAEPRWLFNGLVPLAESSGPLADSRG